MAKHEFAALFEYRLHPPKIPGPRKGTMIDSGPPLVFRFLHGALQIGIGQQVHTIQGSRLAELLDVCSEHLRGPTTSAPDQVRVTLQRLTTANPENETYADLELRL